MMTIVRFSPALADRLAEAAAEWLHWKTRTEIWGYSAHEDLDHEALIAENHIRAFGLHLGIRRVPTTR